jgi:hypothetical protein
VLDREPRKAGSSTEPKEMKAGNEDGPEDIGRPKRTVKPNPKYFSPAWNNR